MELELPGGKAKNAASVECSFQNPVFASGFTYRSQICANLLVPVLLVKNQIKEDLLAKYLYVFINCKRTQCRVLYFGRSGYCLSSKRLEQGQFHPHAQDAIKRVPEWTGLKLMFDRQTISVVIKLISIIVSVN